MCFVIIKKMINYFDFCCFRAMTQQSILDLVVNWKVFTINICCFIAKILFQISIFTIFSISP